MLKIFVWFVSDDTKNFQTAAKILERQHGGVELVGTATGSEISTAREISFDVLLVVGAKNIGMSKITKAAAQFGVDTEKLLGDWIVCVSGFTLGLQFNSPFVNMLVSVQEYLRFLRAPRVYMQERLVFKQWQWQSVLKFDYPVFTLGNIDLHMNPCRNFDAAKIDWQRRKDRINWYNLFVAAYTTDENILREFDALPYGKKVPLVEN